MIRIGLVSAASLTATLSPEYMFISSSGRLLCSCGLWVTAPQRSELTSLPYWQRARKANVKSKTPLETCICEWSFDSNIRKMPAATNAGMGRVAAGIKPAISVFTMPGKPSCLQAASEAKLAEIEGRARNVAGDRRRRFYRVERRGGAQRGWPHGCR